MSQKHKGKKTKPELGLFPERPEVEPAVNREPRTTATILIDVTSSLAAAWAVYVAALRRTFDECGKHPAARSSAFVSVGLCGPKFVPTPYLPFARAELPEFVPQGGSPGGMWITSSVWHLRAEHERMRADAVPSNKDVYLLISDFHFDDGEDAFNEAVEAYRTLEKERPQLNGFFVTAGRQPNRELAARVSRKRAPVHLDELKVEELFRWVTGVVQRASMSQPGQKVELPSPTWTLNDDDRQ